MLVIFFLLTAALFSFYLVLKIFESRFRVKKRIEVFVNKEKDNKADNIEKESTIKSSILQFRNIMSNYMGRKVSSKQEENYEKKLLQAGNPFGITAIDFQVLKLLLLVLIPGTFVIYGTLLKLGVIGVTVLVVIGTLLALFMPNYYIKVKTKHRYKLALMELPDFLDLLTVCLEAGLGFDGALNKVISKRSGILSSEFHICIEEIRLGKTRKEALTGLKGRLEFDEIKSLINSILQAEKLGISIVQILRIKSQEEREKRKQRAEEEAMKAPIKILFPLVLFIFPSIFTVLLGPAIIRLLTELGK